MTPVGHPDRSSALLRGALVVLACLAVVLAGGGLFLLPLALLVAPLLLGRYVGEERIERLAAAMRPAPARRIRGAVAASVLPRVRGFRWRDALLASRLAERGPPALA